MFLQLFSRPCLSLLERPSTSDNPRLLEIVLTTLASLLASFPFFAFFFQFIASSVLPIVDSQLIEMIASLEPMASIGAKLAGILYDRMNHHSELVSDLIKEVVRRNASEPSTSATSATSATSIRNLAHFIVFVEMAWHDRRFVQSRFRSRFCAVCRCFCRCWTGNRTRCAWPSCSRWDCWSRKRAGRRRARA